MEPSTEMTTMAATSVASAIRQGEARSNTPVRSRHLESVEAASTSAVGVGFIQFPVYGRTSEGVKGGVTSVRFTSTDDGSDIPLTAPAAITMTASLTSASVIPWCAYYNQETAGWEADGLVIGSASVQASDASDSNSSDVEVLCLSYHLSDFAVSTADSDGIFAPVDVTAALEVFSAVRNSSWGGIITVVGAVMVLIGIGVAVTHTGKGRTAEGIVTEKIVVRYVETGEATRNPTFVAVGRKQSRVGPRTAKRRRRTIPAGRRLVHKLAETRRAWYDRACALFAQVIQNHPWIAIVSPSTSNLALTPTQLSLLLFAQVMVQMMVEAAFSSNATSLNVKVAQVIVGSAATIPGSMLLPYLFEAAAAPPQSITTNEKWHNIALPARQRTHKQVEGASSSEQGYIGSRLNDSVAPTTAYEGAGGKDVKSRHRDNTFLSLLQLVQSAVPSPSTASSSETPPGDIGHDAVRGRGLVFTCMTQILLDLVCLALSVVSGWDTLLRQILITASAANVLLAVLTIDAVLAARTSMFSLLNFKAVLGLAFTRVCVSLLQAVTAFQDLRTRTVTEAKERRLELVIFVFAALKIIACYTGEILPSMDATRKTSMSRLSWAKKYRPGRRSSMRKSVSGDQVGHKALMIVHDKAATRIQALVRMEQACKRSTRKKEIMQWHSPEVYTLRRKLTIRAYAWLGLYAGTAVWINLCFVFAYDTPTIRSWVTATGITIAIEIVFRKPLSVLVKASIQTLRNIVSVPGPVYVGKGANRQPLSRVSI